MVTNCRLAEDGPDFYVTPAWGTEALVYYEQFHGDILEPCCGDGAMSKVLIKAGYDVISSDLYDRGYGTVGDFFDIREPVANIVTNPPFGIAEDVLDHAMSLAQDKICLLLRTAFVESASRYNRFFKNRAPARILTFTQRLSMYPSGQQGKLSGGTTAYSWFVWEKSKCNESLSGYSAFRRPENFDNDLTQMIWIKPGFKPGRAKLQQGDQT